MAESLFPVVDVPEIIDDSDEVYDVKYKRSLAWDWEQEDFVRDGGNRVVECDGQEAFKTWCGKMIDTERYTCLAYPDALGAEMQEAIAEEDNDAIESAIERTITETLLVNPRTEYVRDFEFEREADSLWCSFAVKGVSYEEFRMQKRVGGE